MMNSIASSVSVCSLLVSILLLLVFILILLVVALVFKKKFRDEKLGGDGFFCCTGYKKYKSKEAHEMFSKQLMSLSTSMFYGLFGSLLALFFSMNNKNLIDDIGMCSIIAACFVFFILADHFKSCALFIMDEINSPGIDHSDPQEDSSCEGIEEDSNELPSHTEGDTSQKANSEIKGSEMEKPDRKKKEDSDDTKD